MKKVCKGCSPVISKLEGTLRQQRGLRGVMSSPPVVPCACKNLIKDRMERSGMRWTEQMAEAIVQLRAIYLSGDFDRYWQFHIDQDQRRLYPVAWAVVPK